MSYRVFIPCAGTGSRLGSMSSTRNKALVTIAGKPSISHIIEKVDPMIPIVIALGYKGDTVRDFLTLAYPDRNFIFITIDKFEGPGSGLGYTLMKCKHELQCPFIFCSNDTIVAEKLPEPSRNWMGYSEAEDTKNYRSIRTSESIVTEICSKGALGDVKPYIGLCGVHDFSDFWNAMVDDSEQAVEIGESHGLRNLIKNNVVAIHFTWYDTGNPESLSRTRAILSPKDAPNILEKEGEAIWFVGDRVLKFSTDESFINKRTERAKYLVPFVPQIIGSSKNIYIYRKVEGEIFSKHSRPGDFAYLLEWLNGFWAKKHLQDEEAKRFRAACRNFYKEKTYSRISQFLERFEQIDTSETINGERIPKIFDILDGLDWDWICDGIPSRFHGDLHFENVLINNNHKIPFTLLDWRQDFGGIIEYGDMYYDLAKINHGLIISHELINRDLFSVYRKLDNIEFDFLRKQNLVDCQDYFKKYVIERGYDYKKVEAMTYLIFLNIAALHHYPYCLLLFYLGKTGLYRLSCSKKQEMRV